MASLQGKVKIANLWSKIRGVDFNEFDPVWLRNAIEEPLDEADIKKGTRLEE